MKSIRALSPFLCDAAGWYGTAAVVSAYGLTSLAVLPPQHLLVIGLNLTGAAGLVASSGHHRAYPALALNAVWILIALASLLRALL